jgi:aspartate-semialdehyde dehydrogenase
MIDKTFGIIGATGAVGIEAIKLFEKKDIDPKRLRLFASKKSAGKGVSFKGHNIKIEELTHNSFDGIDFIISSIEASLSKEFIPSAVKSGCIVIDNSSAFRMDDDVPLVIPEINPDDIKTHKGIIANPNCTAIVMIMAIYPIYKLSKIRQIIFSSYQAVSGAGIDGIVELDRQAKEYTNNKPITKSFFKHQIFMNVFSHDTEILDNGFNGEEQKVINETRKILHDPNILVSPTCVRVPVMRSHSVSASIVTEDYLELDDIRDAINKSNGVKLVDDRANNHFPMPIETTNQGDVFVGRIRRGFTHKNEIMLFACGDQLLKGAALNAVQIMELML